MTLHVKVGGSWKEIVANAFIKTGGSWRNIEQGDVRVSGSWRTFYVRDTTGPGVPTNCVAQWTGGTNCSLSWTNPVDSDYSYMEIQRYRDGVGLDPTIYTVSSPTAAWVDLNVPDYYRIYVYHLTPVDTRGNRGATTLVGSMAWTGTMRGRYPSPFTFDPTMSATWRSPDWRTGIGSRVYQGTTAAGNNIGVYFYGDVPYNTLFGSVITGMSITAFRASPGGYGAQVEPEAHWCEISSTAGTPYPGGVLQNMWGGPEVGPGLCINGGCSNWTIYALPAGWWDPWFDPTSSPRAKSIALYSTDTSLVGGIGNVSMSYMQMFGYNELIYGVLGGRLTVTHGG